MRPSDKLHALCVCLEITDQTDRNLSYYVVNYMSYVTIMTILKILQEEKVMCENRFYVCEHCGNLVGLIHDAGVPLMCCGQKMTKLEPGTVEASHEKHIPVVKVDGDAVTVTIGSAPHPMLEEHNIQWVYLQTDRGGHRKCLEVGKDPMVKFVLCDEKPLAAYAYCNLHGLWKADI